MGHLVGDWLVPVSRVAAGVGVGWHTAHEAFVQVAADAQIVITDTRTGPAAGGGHADPVGDPPPATADPATPAARPCRAVSGAVPPVAVLGIDEHRRGKPLYHRDPATGAWVVDADRWQTVFVDATGGHGLLGQVEGRAGVDAGGWLAA
jgi:hypothetical protein